MNTARIFLTDYASYNAGTQFEFGHWVNLEKFEDADELQDYIKNHFEKCDKESPLDSWGSKREEPMFTDFEGFPREFYSESGIDFDVLYQWLDLDDNEKLQLAAAMYDLSGFAEAWENKEDYLVHEGNPDTREKWDLFEIYYPELQDKIESACDYSSIDYDLFIEREFCEFRHDGKLYMFKTN